MLIVGIYNRRNGRVAKAMGNAIVPELWRG
jgi:hypothetical protein